LDTVKAEANKALDLTYESLLLSNNTCIYLFELSSSW